MLYTCPKFHINDAGVGYEGCGTQFMTELDEGYIECPSCGLNFEPCECNGHSALVGVRWPNGSDKDHSLPWVERCDMCQAFDSDLDAAVALAAEVGGILAFTVHPRHDADCARDVAENGEKARDNWLSPFVIVTADGGEAMFNQAYEAENRHRNAAVLKALYKRYPAQDQACNAPEGHRLVLVERSRLDGGHFFTGHDSQDSVVSYHKGQECPEDWEIVALYDGLSGSILEVVA